MRIIYSDVDLKILEAVSQGPAPNRSLLKVGLAISTEPYVYQRLRQLEARGYITRTGKDRMVTITPEGREALTHMADVAERRAIT